MNWQKWMLPAAVIVVLSGCGNDQEAGSNQQDTYTSSTPTVQSSTNTASIETIDATANSSTSELSTQEKEDIRLYFQKYTASGKYIGHELSTLGNMEGLSADATDEEIVIHLQQHMDNVNQELQKLESMEFPQITNENIRKEVEDIRDNMFYIASASKDLLANAIEYIQSEDESLYEQSEQLTMDMATATQLLQQQMEQLAPKLQ